MKEGNVVQHHGLYRSELEHDNCGIGAIVNIKGQKSHDTVANALKIVENLEHRAGKDAEGKTGDGVGILLQVSHRFFSKVCKPLGIFLGSERDYGVGMFFFPQDELKRNQAKKIFEVIVKNEGMNFLGWREVTLGFFLGCIIGSIIHLLLMKFAHKGRQLAFGPYLSAGMVIAMLFGDNLIKWYLGLF